MKITMQNIKNDIEIDVETYMKNFKFNINNKNFMKYSNIRNRLNTQLFYIHFNFENIVSSGVSANMFDDNMLKTIPALKDKFSFENYMSINAVDIDIPTITQSLQTQRIFNRNYQFSTGGKYDGNINVNFVESNDLFITNFFNAFKDINFSANATTASFYPGDLFFDITIIPLRMVKFDEASGRELLPAFSGKESVMFFQNCLFESIPDADYNLSTASEINMVKVSFQYEKRYTLNRFIKMKNKKGTDIIEITD